MDNLRDEQGFTLVEVTVVLSMAAILAAALTPSLTSYVDEANKRKTVAEARNIMMATQTTVAKWFGTKREALLGLAASGARTFTVALNDILEPAADRDRADFIADVEHFAEVTFADPGAIGENPVTTPLAKAVISNLNGAWTLTELMYYGGTYSAYICAAKVSDSDAGAPQTLVEGDVTEDTWYLMSGNRVTAPVNEIGDWEN